MRSLLSLSIAWACACSAARETPPATPSHVTVPEWVEGCAAPNSAPATTIAVPKVDDRFVTKTLGPSTPSEPKWSSRRIDLDVKNADIHDVCRLLAEVGKVNIVVADDVQGSVTVKMTRVPWDEALDVILRAKGFDSLRDGNVILVFGKTP